MLRRTLLMVPGYDEPSEDLEILATGRHDIPGLRAHGFECVTLPRCYEQLGRRIERLAEFVEGLRADGYPFPITLVGYSLGGLVARGYLRAHPSRARDVRSIVMIGTPNFGVITRFMPELVRIFRIPDQAIDDLSHDSDFLAWLNRTGGHWERDPRTRASIWTLDREPWLAPQETRCFVVAGLLRTRWRYNERTDGVVGGDSASLGSRFPTHYIIGPHCNHMNLIGHFDPLVFLWTGFVVNDLVWPHTLRAILRFCGATGRVTAKT
ncbi:MAG: lipase family alpha/beta hydrolase [Candidatus Tyrphobacter sp.]